MENRPVEDAVLHADGRTDGQTDGQDKGKKHFSRLCESA
jgi:hypothetical protein